METQQNHHNANTLKDIVSGFEGAGIGIVVIVFLFLFLNYFNILRLYQLFSFLSFLPHKQYQTNQIVPHTISKVPSKPLDQCTVEKKGNALVHDVHVLNDVIVGTYMGNIVKMMGNPATQTTGITLVSLDNTETYSFTIKNSVPVYDKTNRKTLSFIDLQEGQKVVMQFNCHSNQGNVYTITDIGIMRN